MAGGNVAVLSDNAVLPETLKTAADMINWSVSKYSTRQARRLDARWFAGMFTNGRRKTMVDPRGIRHDMDTGS